MIEAAKNVGHHMSWARADMIGNVGIVVAGIVVAYVLYRLWKRIPGAGKPARARARQSSRYPY